VFDIAYRKNNRVKLVDYMMGAGKSTGILDWMDANPQNSYIFVSPLLSEVEEGGRVHTHLKNVSLEIPSDSQGSKSSSLLSMLKAGDSIACTHSLYLSMTDRHFTELELRGYVVIIDEEVDVIDGFNKCSKDDLQWLLEKGDISIRDEDGMVEWVGSRDKITSKHKYHSFLQYCDAKALYSTKRSDTMMVSQLPIKLFEVAKEVIILTYMFDGNILDSFLKLKGFEVEKFNGFTCTNPDKGKIRELLTVIPPNRKLKNYSMSSTWWSEANGKQINDVANFIRTAARGNGLVADDVLWTIPKSRAVKQSGQSKNLMTPRGYTRDSSRGTCYLSATTRATNDYAHKKGMFHCYNRRPLVPVSAYLQDYDCNIDFKVFAVSEMVQWLWRGCIRNGEPMVVAIGSERMYNYFTEWLNDDGVI
jgi:hypothetical protein